MTYFCPSFKVLHLYKWTHSWPQTVSCDSIFQPENRKLRSVEERKHREMSSTDHKNNKIHEIHNSANDYERRLNNDKTKNNSFNAKNDNSNSKNDNSTFLIYVGKSWHYYNKLKHFTSVKVEFISAFTSAKRK